MSEIFKYKSASRFFSDALQLKKAKNPLFSLRAAASQIGTSPSTLSFFINGKKKLTNDTGRKICHWLKLSPVEEDFFLKLLELENSKDEGVKQKIDLALTKNEKVQDQRSKHQDFNLLNDWVNVVLMACFMSPEIRKKDLKEIAAMMNVPVKQVEESFRLLKEKGLLLVDGGKIVPSTKGLVFDSPLPQKDLKLFHKTMLQKAMLAVDEQTNKERFIGSETFGFDENNLELAKEIIDDFLNRMVALSQKSKGQHIYHLGTQFFKITK